MRSVVQFFRVVFALVLREARVRHGRARIGYSWAIIEPVLMTLILTFLFAEVSSRSNGRDFALFFATGVLTFQLFRNTSIYVSMAFEQNRPLFNYPMVKPIDAAVARLVLDSSTYLVVIVLVLCFQILVLEVPPPEDIPFMAFAAALMTMLAFGAGLTLAVLKRFIPSISNAYLVILGPAFFVSCVFFPLAGVPTLYRDILVWNPLVHGIEGFRSGYYPVYGDQDIDFGYLFIWVVFLNFVGLVGEWLTRFKQQ